MKWRDMLPCLLPFMLCNGVGAASFDCDQARLTHVEKLICTRDDLQLQDSDISDAYRQALLMGRDTAAVVAAQRRWIATRNACSNGDCLAQTYAVRLAALRKVAKAGWRPYGDMKTGLHFRYLENRAVKACVNHDTGRCFTLSGPGLKPGSAYFLQFELVDGSLDATAASLWERIDGKWMASGRGGNASDVETFDGDGWRGLVATTVCGVGDANGFHGAGGDCATYVMSNGKKSVVMTTDGASGSDAATLATIRSVAFKQAGTRR